MKIEDLELLRRRLIIKALADINVERVGVRYSGTLNFFAEEIEEIAGVRVTLTEDRSDILEAEVVDIFKYMKFIDR